MVHLSNNEECLHNFLFRSFKCLSGNTGSTVSMFQKKKLKNLYHSLSNKSPIVSMEMALAEAFFQL